jgi:hypothetical protein
MRDNGFWKVFRDTGDPLCYVIARRIEKDGLRSGMPAGRTVPRAEGSLVGTAPRKAKASDE